MPGLEVTYMSIPPITRGYITLVFIITFLTYLEVVSPYHLYYVPELAIRSHQYWRLLTTFLFFGPLSLDFIFHMFFLYRYSRWLEEASYRQSPSAYLYLLLLGSTCMLLITAVALPPMSIPFLGPSLTFMLVYIWSRRNPLTPMNFLGLFVVPAPYLPWVLLAFSWLLSGKVAKEDLMGIGVGHLFWWLEDVYPRTVDLQGRRRGPVLKTPSILKRLLDPTDPATATQALQEEETDTDSDMDDERPLMGETTGARAAPTADGEGARQRPAAAAGET